jgi:hypothetical protein
LARAGTDIDSPISCPLYLLARQLRRFYHCEGRLPSN